MVLLLPLLLVFLIGVNCEVFIFISSHLLFSCYESSFFLCELFLDSDERDQLPSCIDSLNEWVPWSRETIQGSHYNSSFFDVLVNRFKLFFDLSNLCEVRLYSLRFLYLHILQLVPQFQLPINVISFKQLRQSIEHFLGVFKDDTCGMRWSLTESTMILLALTKFFLWVSLASSPFGSGTCPLMY